MKHERITVSTTEAADIIGVTGTTMRRMCLENKIKHVRMKNGPSDKTTYLVFLDDLKKMLKPYEPPKDIKLHIPKRRPGRPESIVL